MHNFPKCVAQSFVDDFFELIAESLARGEEVKLSGFGNFEIKLKHNRLGRNPQTGEDVMIVSRHIVTFRAGHKLQARLVGQIVDAESGEIINLDDLSIAAALHDDVELIHEIVEGSNSEHEIFDDSLPEEWTVSSTDELLISSGETVTTLSAGNIPKFLSTAVKEQNGERLTSSGTVSKNVISTSLRIERISPVLNKVDGDSSGDKAKSSIGKSLSDIASSAFANAQHNAVNLKGSDQDGYNNLSKLDSGVVSEQSYEAVGQAASTIHRHTQLPRLETKNQEVPSELIKNLDAQSRQDDKHTLFSQAQASQFNQTEQNDELYLDAKQRERNLQHEQKFSQKLHKQQSDEQALAQEINREMELKQKRKAQQFYRHKKR